MGEDRSNGADVPEQSALTSAVLESSMSPSLAQWTPPPNSISSRQLVAGRYELLALLGCGGMGTVYRARDCELDEEVALKVLRRELVDMPGILDRFKLEVKLARRVTHRNVARAFDIGEHAAEKFITMEYIDGEPLSQLVAREGSLSPARIIELTLAVCDGLAAAHAAGIIHRDLKPDNIMISRADQRVVITDFGIARALSDSSKHTIGTTVGTPAYMAPEQVEGARDIDERADIYALGVILYELFVGDLPWSGDSVFAVAAARLTQPPPDPRVARPALNESLARIIRHAMARQPSQRLPSATALAEMLKSIDFASQAATQAGLTPPVIAPRTAREDKTVAVLPLRNASPDDEYLADGLTEDIIDLLSMTPGLKVRPRGAIMHLKGSTQDVRELGKSLGVQVVVEGSLRKAGSAIRLSTRLINVQDGFQLWARRFDKPAADMLTVTDEVATAIAEALTVEAQPAARSVPTDPLALDAYFRARFEYHKYERTSLERAIGLFEQARGLAPDDPMILTGYALALVRLWFFGSPTAADHARQVAERALALAPQRAEPHVALSAVCFQAGDCFSAVLEAKRALAIQPNQPDAHDMLGKILTETGPVDLGIEHFERAAQLDPSFDNARASAARVHGLAGRWELADWILTERLHASDRTAPVLQYTRIMLWRRDAEGARALLAMPKLQQPAHTAAAALLRFIIDPSEATNPAHIHARNLLSPLASWRSHTLAHQYRTEIALTLGDETAAFNALDDAVRTGLVDLVWLDMCPLFEGHRAHPRFLELRKRVELRTEPIRQAMASAPST